MHFLIYCVSFLTCRNPFTLVGVALQSRRLAKLEAAADQNNDLGNLTFIILVTSTSYITS